MHIAVEGMDGVGKTSTAKLLAEMLGFQYHSKALHKMKYFNAPDAYDNFITLNECLDEKPAVPFEYGIRASFLYDRMSNVDTVTERYFCSNYAVSPTQSALQAIEKSIEIFGVPNLTVILYCDPKINYRRMYNRNPNDKDFYKLKAHENFYSDIKKCVEIFNLPCFFLDTSALTLEEVCYKLVVLIKNLSTSSAPVKKFSNVISDNGLILNSSRTTVIGLQENFQGKKIVIPDGVKTIGFSSFASTAVEEIILNSDCEKIGCSAFFNCKNLRSVKLGTTTNYIGKNAFAGCDMFKMFGNSRNFMIRDNMLFQNRKIIKCNAETPVFDDEFSIEHVAWSFENNPFIKSISAQCLKKIGSYAYKNSALQEITLSACTEIGDRAFWNCRDLKRIKFLSKQPPKIGQEIFFGLKNNVEILVPAENINSYETTFQNYKNNIQVKRC